MISIDKCAYTNNLTNVHPSEKVFFVVITIVICLMLDSVYVSLLIITIMSMIIVFKAGISAKLYLKLMIIPCSFLLLSILTILITKIDNSNEIIVSVNIFGLKLGIIKSSIVLAFKLFLKSLSSVSCLYFLSLTTPIIDIMHVFETFKLPNILIELSGLIYRQIFSILIISNQIFISQNSRLGYSSVRSQYRSMSSLITRTFILSYKKITELFTSLESRCYTDKINVLGKTYKFSLFNIISIIFIDSMLVLIGIYTHCFY